MYILNDIAYANSYNIDNIKVTEIKIISELCMLVTFSNGEKKIFDAKPLLIYPVYEKLQDFNIFKNAYIEYGAIIWDNGNIDIAPETVYRDSYVYEQNIA